MAIPLRAAGSFAVDAAGRLADQVLIKSYSYAFFAAPAPLRRFHFRLSYDALSVGLSAALPRGLRAPALDEMTAGSGFLNYGYADEHHDGFVAGLAPQLRPRSHSIRLYHHVVEDAEPSGKDVLEVGCGRGGGCHYMKHYLAPATVTGVDISPRAIAFCNSAFAAEGLTYAAGDAEALPLEDASFDVVVNVESSHCYGSMPAFLAETRRVLRPGGVLAWADVRPRERLAATEQEFGDSGLVAEAEENISEQVLLSLEAASDEKIALIEAQFPLALRALAKSGMAVRGTLVYEALRRGDLVYVSRLMSKPESG